MDNTVLPQGQDQHLSSHRERRNAVSLSPNPPVDRIGQSTLWKYWSEYVAKSGTSAQCLLKAFTNCDESTFDTSVSNVPASPIGASAESRRLEGSHENIESRSVVAERFYSPLYEWETRILTLYPGKHGDELRGAIRPAILLYGTGVLLRGTHERIEYDALSHCWGEPKFCREVLCNGDRYPITEDLWTALQYLRKTNEPRHLWVDAICINQHDDRERSVQVAGMLNIYKKARKVIVWLGPYGMHTQLAFHRWQLVDAVAWQHFGPHEFEDLFSDEFRTKLFSPKDARPSLRLCWRCPAAVLTGLDELMDRPWFSRVWVKQEVWAAQNIEIACGNITFGWELLSAEHGLSALLVSLMGPLSGSPNRAKLDKLRDREASIGRSFPRSTPFAFAQQQVGDVPNNGLQDNEECQHDIVNVLRRSMGSQCSDLRDHVYGVLGMSRITVHSADNDVGNSFKVDYSRTASQVSQDLALYIIARERNLSILYMDATYGYDVLESDFVIPSWTPDWRSWTRSVSEWRHGDIGLRSSSLPQQHQPGMLSLQGLILGTLIPPMKYDASDKAAPPFSSIIHHEMLLTRIEHSLTERLKSGLASDTEIQFLALWEHATSAWVIETYSRAKEGDVVVAVDGGYAPLLLRPSTVVGRENEATRYSFLGYGLIPDHMNLPLRGLRPTPGTAMHDLFDMFDKAVKVACLWGVCQSFDLV